MDRLRPSLVLLVLLWAAPALAHTPIGVWIGKLGRAKVAACFDDRSSAYYYVKIGVDIPLVAAKSGRWQEKTEERPSTGTWQLAAPEGETLTGTWTSPDGKRTQPIRLQAARDPVGGEPSTPALARNCLSPAYDAPRLTAVVRTPGKPETRGWLTVRRFTAIDGSVTGLEIVGSSPALAPLKQAVEKLNRTLLGGYFDCASGAASSSWADVEYGGVVALEEVTEHFVVVRQSSGYFCGGAHPDGSSAYYVFERKGGKAVNLEDWLKVPPDTIGREHWTNDQEGCTDALMDDTSFVVWPTSAGMVFQPRLPHAIDACAKDVTVPYAKLAGQLSAVGKRATAEFAGAAK